MAISVLYVDDELPHLMLAKEYLERSGLMELTCVSSGGEAIERLKDEEFEVIVSDYLMQDMNGIELLRYVRTHLGHIPFLIFTGKGKEDVVISALNSGADYYIRKGSEPETQFLELEQRIIQAHKRHQTGQELSAREELYQAVLTVQREFFVDFLPDYTIIRVNEGYAQLHGTIPADLIGKKFTDGISDDERAALAAVISQLSPESPEGKIPLTLHPPGGDPARVNWVIEGVFGTDGNLANCRGTGRDSSDEELARKNLKESEERYQMAASDLPRDMGDFDENVPLNFIIENTRSAGTWPLDDLIRETKNQKMDGVASATGSEGYRSFLIFVNGEPEGGIYIDRNGVLYGDKSVLFLKNSQVFTFYPTDAEIASRFVTGCRIYDKSRIRATVTHIIPEISSVRKGIGIIAFTILRNGAPVGGTRITVKNLGKIVGNEVTSQSGQTTFQLLYGKYTGVIHNEGDILGTFQFQIQSPDSRQTIELTS